MRIRENGTLYSTQLFELSLINDVLPTPDRASKDDREARIRNLLWKVRDTQGHELARLRLERRLLVAEELGGETFQQAQYRIM